MNAMSIPSTFKQRLTAYFLDLLLIWLYGFLILFVSSLFGFPFSSFFSQSPLIAQMVGFLSITFPVSLYFFIFEYKKKGTFGKRWMSIKIKSSLNRQISLYQIFIRTIVKIFPWELAHFVIWRFQLPTTLPNNLLYFFLVIVYLIMIVNLYLVLRTEKKQALHDLLAHTQVIVESKTRSID